jgi:hypothetical protein
MLSANHERKAAMSPRDPSRRSRPSRMACSIDVWPSQTCVTYTQTGFNEQVDVKARIAVAQVDNAAHEYQPIAPPADRNAGKPKLGDVAAFTR